MITDPIGSSDHRILELVIKRPYFSQFLNLNYIYFGLILGLITYSQSIE